MTNFIVNQVTDDGTGLTTGTLSYAILQANQLAGDDTITIESDVRLTGVMQTVVDSNINIVGNNYSISGDANNNGINDNSDVRSLFIQSGTVSISDLIITNGRAQGGDSGFGGGGAGMGGGLFIYDGNLSLTNVAFSNNTAQGGSSGIGGNGIESGGGYGSNGGFGGGGGGGAYYGNAGSGGYGGGGGGSGYASGGSGGFGGGAGLSGYGTGGGAGLGGGIFVRSGSLTLNNTSFTDNTATGGTGANPGQGLGGAIFIMQSTTNTNGNNQGMPTVLPTVNSVDSQPTFSGNSAANDASIANNNDDIYGTINVTSTPPTGFTVTESTDDGTGNTVGTLSWAILQANQIAGDDTINIESDVRVTGVMKTLVNSNITIVGNNHSISGDANNNGINDDGDVRSLFILSGTVGISDLIITNGRAEGGDSYQGGGGAGMGGGLFIYDGDVSLTNIAFINNTAQGGSSRSNIELKSGGGGMFGNGGAGGGGLFANATTGGGGYGGNGNYDGGYNTGYSGSTSFGGGGDPKAIFEGGFGGGGSNGANGGFGGGGGYNGGNGGYGGGGGGNGYSGNIISYGGFGGSSSISSNGFGGNGAGMGGGVFVRSGTVVLNNTSFTNNTAIGGSSVDSSISQGLGLGGAIFIMQSTTNTNGNNQGMPTVLPTVNSVDSQPTFSGNSAANDAGITNNNDDIYGTINVTSTPSTVSLTAQTATANEGGSNGVYRITRTNTTGDLTVNLSLDGNSTASTADYTLSGGSITVTGSTLTVTIAAGQSFVDVDLAAIDDIATEANETLKLNLDSGTGYTIDGTNNTATVTIADNDTIVTNTNNSGEGSLRQAILNANANPGADTITFDTSAGSVFADGTPDTITLTSGELLITDAVTINGLGASNLSISGNNTSGIFLVDDSDASSEIAVTINGLKITDAFALSGPLASTIQNREDLTINNSTISGNTASYGGIYNLGTATITNSTISDNTVSISTIFNTLRATITNSTISGNSSNGGIGGILNIGESVVINNSTISGNTGNIGGILNQGPPTATVTITNSTISGNAATGDGGGILNTARLNLINSTITNNTADFDNNGSGNGGGVYNFGTLTAQNTIIAGNFDSGNQATDIAGAVTGNANNLIGSLTGASGSIGTGSDITFTSAGITNINQVLASLANNGGATFTHAIVSGSAAINAGDNTLIPSGVTTDQRGITRTIGGTVDIGAYESSFIAPVAANDTATTDENTAVNINVLGNDTDANGDSLTVTQVNGNSVTVGTPITLASGALLTLNANSTFDYNPNGQFESLGVGATASDSFIYTASDNGGNSTATVNLTINGVNDAPTVANIIANQTTLEDGFFNFTVPTNTFADVDASDSLTYTATLANGNALPTWLSFDSNTRTFSGTPNDPDNGTISIKVTATDSSNASVDDTFDLTVTPVNDAPVAGDDSSSANQNTTLTLLSGNLLANDTDVDGGALSITAVSNSVNGTVTLNNNGNVVFTPTTGFSGNGSFNYSVSDGNGGTDLGMVTVAIGIDLNGTSGNDVINGTSGNDIINALNGDDTVFGNAGNDNLIGGNGEDILYGGTANDQIYGGNSNDNLYGNAGNDHLEGDNGNDNLYGDDGNDNLLGGNGQDLLVGGGGNDFLNGGKQDDTSTGGTGSDIFVLEQTAGRDTITDFSLGQGDKIGLSGLSFSQLSFSGDEIRIGNQTLAILTAFDTTTLMQNNFISV
jgi:Ca2+-binding RTX toxin-like protein